MERVESKSKSVPKKEKKEAEENVKLIGKRQREKSETTKVASK